jgi:hypothetical protein
MGKNGRITLSSCDADDQILSFNEPDCAATYVNWVSASTTMNSFINSIYHAYIPTKKLISEYRPH